ncbi:MAG: site-specific DNA-methyltransferase [Candidatus ainarchaeum sp.]|nr:site-specific DNA-methyltransferase [Candidatus ainarchaeum sp.]
MVTKKAEEVKAEETERSDLENSESDGGRTAPKYEDNKLNGRIELVWPSKDYVFWDIYNGQPVWKRNKDIPLRIIRQREIIGQSNCVYNSEKKEWVRRDAPIQSENLLIRGDNLLALKALEEDFAGEVKLIYIDPPFNTGAAFEHYEDNLEQSTWLSMMRPRLEILKKLLSQDGVIFVHIDNRELGYLILLMNDVFLRKNFVQIISEKRASPAGFKTINPGPITVTDYILMYCKNKELHKFKPQYRLVNYDENYDLFILNPEAKPEEWKFKRINDLVLEKLGFHSWKDAKNTWGSEWKSIRASLAGTFALENAPRIVSVRDPHKPSELIKQKIAESKKQPDRILIIPRKEHDDIYILNGGALSFYSNKIRTIDGVTGPTELITDLWDDINYAGIAQEGEVKFKNSKKPEMLLKRIIEMASEPGELVLDSFAGSGTTAAVAHKLGRRWLTIEIGKHAETLCKPRLRRVVSGEDQTGISKQVNWKGGGGFAYCELGDPLVITDKELGIQRINPKYNNGDLILAICKLEGFKLMSKGKRVLHGKRGMTFAHVTEFYVTQEYLNHLTKEVDEDQKLIIYCYAHTSKLKLPKNVEVRRMPDQLSNKDGDSNE